MNLIDMFLCRDYMGISFCEDTAHLAVMPTYLLIDGNFGGRGV